MMSMFVVTCIYQARFGMEINCVVLAGEIDM
jgi:hypothetical protein